MIRVESLCVHVGSFALRELSFDLATGTYGVLMGKTGSGKTTLVEAICGLRAVESGRIVLLDRDVTHLKTADRGVGYVPQDLALFPTMTVREHLSFALEVRGQTRLIAERVAELSRLLRIEHLLGRRPQGLSGGESQRVALGRALSFHPRILLLDEPLSALDQETREEMYQMLREVQQKTGVTTLHITHSPAEARRLADQLLILKDGKIRQARLEELESRGSEP
jgi:ABC-type sugar transport system ATPase subunit